MTWKNNNTEFVHKYNAPLRFYSMNVEMNNDIKKMLILLQSNTANIYLDSITT